MDNPKLDVERAESGALRKVTLTGFGDTIEIKTNNDLKAIKELQFVLARRQHACALLSKEIYKLAKEQKEHTIYIN